MSYSVFISCIRKDESFMKYIVNHFAVAKKQWLFIWDDWDRKGESDWRREIDTALSQAKFAILLISHHSLTSDFALDEEVSTMFHRRDDEGLVVYPIGIHACDWVTTEKILLCDQFVFQFGLAVSLYQLGKCFRSEKRPAK